MTDVTAVAEQMQKFNEAVQFLQTEVKSLKGEQNDSIRKAGEVAADAAAAIQAHRVEAEAETKALKSTVETLQKQIARGLQSDAGAVISEAEQMYGKQMVAYLKGRKPIDGQLLSDMANEIVAKQGLDAMSVSAMEQKAMYEGSNPDGGYWLRPDRAAQTIGRIFETSPMRQLANVINVTSNSLEIIIDDDEADSAWTGEMSVRAEQGTPQIGKLTIPVQEGYTILRASQRSLDDIVDLESWLMAKAADKLSRQENTGFILGNSALQPQGLMTLAAATNADIYERGKIGTYTSTGDSAVLNESDDFKALQNLVKEPYQANATWLMKRTTFTPIINLQDTSGQYIFNSFFINQKDPMTLLGKPVVFMDDMAAVAANSLSVAYGDFRQGYTIVDRLGLRIVRDNITQPGFVKFQVFRRVGGAVTSFDSFKILKTKA